ncbi:hypothetical protein B7494_g328 [Chlorociboria aeruginascens]|nr:hypothetical protein B7494_g328 [Chlorociboria aeruginascens]
MSTAVYPSISPHLLQKEEDDSTARELSWLLNSLQETLASIKSGLEECYALLAPTERGSTLVISSPRSESVKGHITRVGTKIVRGSLHLRLRTHSPLTLHLSPENPLTLTPLTQLLTLLNSALDCVDITRWTGDRTSAPFISSQLHLLHSIILEAKTVLKGPSLLSRSSDDASETWHQNPPSANSFTPPLSPTLVPFISLSEGSLILTLRVLEPVTPPPGNALGQLGTRFALAIGAQRRLEHDEMDEVFVYRGEEVRVKEKVRVESADPNLMSLLSKLAALEHSLQGAKRGLAIVLGDEKEGEEE